MIRNPEFKVEFKLRNGFGDSLLAKHVNHVTESQQSDEWRSITIYFEDIEEACEALSSYGPNIEVTQPVQLREKMILNFEEIARSHV
jgi:predicted DNA-binding transcriptional regulator YafY